ncbi:MAG: hypothetical protein J6X94_11820, partial [Lachnospiraceae bacterium]|nr:hypothetical protein [Lachnospiraceae bacterium]
MSDVFIKILNMSLSASWLILAVIVLRFLLRKAPKWSMCLLWALVAIKLVIPFSPESVLSLIPSNEVIPQNITMESHPHVNSGIVYLDTAVNPVMESNLSPQPCDSANPMQVVMYMAGIVWCAGVILCLAYALVSYILLRRKVRASKRIEDRIYSCDEVASPFILGVFRPVIYIPSGISREITDYVIAHENAHLKRGDHFWKPLGFIILSVYWFNPLCWIAYILLCRDIEYACDEKVIRDKDREYANSYSQALLDCNAQRRIIAACPLAFGETGVKSRIKGILNYKKPAFWIIVVSIVACLVLAVCFLTRPEKERDSAETDPIAAKEYDMTEPPVLTVTYVGDSHEAMLGTYSWYHLNEDGMISGELADSMHPLFLSDLRPVFYLYPYDDEIKLDFAVEPDEVFIKCWDEKYATKGDIDESDFSVLKYTYDTHSFIFPNETGVVIEVSAKWKNENGFDNTARYSFMVTKPKGAASAPVTVTGPDVGSYAESIGLTMSVINITPTECDVIFSQEDGDIRWELETGQGFDIKVLNSRGEWEDIPFIETEYPVVWNDMAYIIARDDDTVMHTQWDYLYGELPDGHYMLHKEVIDFGGPEGSDIYEMYAEFDLPYVRPQVVYPIVVPNDTVISGVSMSSGEGIISCECDFDGNGKPETVTVDYSRILTDG